VGKKTCQNYSSFTNFCPLQNPVEECRNEAERFSAQRAEVEENTK